MSNLNEAIKEHKDSQIERFFGEHKMISNKYFTFKHVQSDDEIILITNNLKSVKNNVVLVIANNQAVYLKDWNIVPVSNFDESIEAYAVKLNRKYFKAYTFQRDFEDIAIEPPETFDSLLATAKEQDAENMKIKVNGWTYLIR